MLDSLVCNTEEESFNISEILLLEEQGFVLSTLDSLQIVTFMKEIGDSSIFVTKKVIKLPQTHMRLAKYDTMYFFGNGSLLNIRLTSLLIPDWSVHEFILNNKNAFRSKSNTGSFNIEATFLESKNSQTMSEEYFIESIEKSPIFSRIFRKEGFQFPFLIKVIDGNKLEIKIEKEYPFTQELMPDAD